MRDKEEETGERETWNKDRNKCNICHKVLLEEQRTRLQKESNMVSTGRTCLSVFTFYSSLFAV